MEELEEEGRGWKGKEGEGKRGSIIREAAEQERGNEGIEGGGRNAEKKRCYGFTMHD